MQNSLQLQIMSVLMNCRWFLSELWQNQQNYMCAQRSLRSAWASAQSDQSSLSAWRSIGSLATQWAHSEDSDQTGRMPRLIWVFAGRTGHLVGFVMSRLINENVLDKFNLSRISSNRHVTSLGNRLLSFYTPPHKMWRVLWYTLRTVWVSVRTPDEPSSVRQSFVSGL